MNFYVKKVYKNSSSPPKARTTKWNLYERSALTASSFCYNCAAHPNGTMRQQLKRCKTYETIQDANGYEFELGTFKRQKIYISEHDYFFEIHGDVQCSCRW